MREVCILLTVAFAAACFACGGAPVGCSDDLDRAVLHQVAEHMGDFGKGAFHTCLFGDTKESLDEYRQKLNNLRTWADGQPDRCVRESYLGWINYYQRKLNESYGELRTHRERDEMARYRAQRDAESERVKKLITDGTIPTPPHK